MSPTGVRTQSDINKDVDACDVFILVLERSWGRRNKNATLHSLNAIPGIGKLRPSNTMEEFTRALERFEKTGKPKVYPVLKKIAADFLPDPGPELKQVLKLKKMLAASNHSIIYEWEAIPEFEKHVRNIVKDFVLGTTLEVTQEPMGNRRRLAVTMTSASAWLNSRRN